MKLDPNLFGKGIARLIRGHSDKVLGPLTARIQQLEAEVEQLKAAGVKVRYMGVWSPELDYQKGAYATDRGSLWHSNTDNNITRPGTPGGAWTLAAKGGKGSRLSMTDDRTH